MTDSYQSAQNRQRAQAQIAASKATDQVTDLGEHIKECNKRLDRLALVNKAMWTILRDKTGLTDIELRSMILEIDAEDGIIDGRLGGQKQVCTSCGRNVAAKQPRCLFCHAEVRSIDPFLV